MRALLRRCGLKLSLSSQSKHRHLQRPVFSIARRVQSEEDIAITKHRFSIFETAGKTGSKKLGWCGSTRRIHHTSFLLAKPKSSMTGHGARKDRKPRPPPVDKPYVPSDAVLAQKSSPYKPIKIFNGMTVKQLTEQMSQRLEVVHGLLTGLGEVSHSSSDIVEIDAAELVAYELGFDAKRDFSVASKTDMSPGRSATIKKVSRPAVITVMGHVDHGKTSLLDALRQTSVAAKEAGGITQHIGAFVVNMPSGTSLTFLDTPGHAAFSAMRARGAAVTDIVVLVVAADDGVMPQTREALSHAVAAHVPLVVAINKCDRPDANPARVREQLGQEGVELEEFGGDVQVVEISATQKLGLDKLEEALLLQAELMELHADPAGAIHAVVVEARLDKGRGPLMTVIVRNGTLTAGLYIVVGSEWGKIRNLVDTSGRQIKSAGPSVPVEVEGLKGLPLAGDDILVVRSEERARKLSESRKERFEQGNLQKAKHLGVQKEAADDPDEELDENENIELVLIVKGDVQGSVEAVCNALQSLNSSQVTLNIVHSGVGAVSLSDVELAETCGASIICFNIRHNPSTVEAAARQSNIEIRQYRVIYHLLEDIGELIVSKAPGRLEDQVAGQAEVLSIFEIKGKGSQKQGAAIIAGCRVFEGQIMRICNARILRSGDLIFEGRFKSLKREKVDVETVGKGNDCGMIIDGFGDFNVGDVIQCIETVRRKPRFVSSESGTVRIEC